MRSGFRTCYTVPIYAFINERPLQLDLQFLVDGTWQHATDQQYVNDDAGNTNNVFTGEQYTLYGY